MGVKFARVESIDLWRVQSVHQQFIKTALPHWLKQSSIKRATSLQTGLKVIPQWSRNASTFEQGLLKRAAEEAWSAQNEADRLVEPLQDLHSFARPLLQKALKKQTGVDVDVDATFVELYFSPKSSWWIIDTSGGVQARKVSLLDAALHNFADHESFTSDSVFISKPDARGHYQAKKIGNLTVGQFKSLCRTLNIGERYKTHLESCLLPVDGLARRMQEQTIIRSQKTALKAAALMAAMKKDIGAEAYVAVLGMLNANRMMKFDERRAKYYHLSILDTRLTGIFLIAANPGAGDADERRVLVYVPHDPEHPLKEYANLAAFGRELTRQLRDTAHAASSSAPGYQTFFSGFVDHDQRGHFFAALNAQLVEITFHGAEPGSALPPWRETAVANPRLNFAAVAFEDDDEGRFTGDPWAYLYQLQLDKILRDGQAQAISTDAADAAERHAWIENLKKMLADIANAALMIAAPFVPGLGEVMMAYMVYQLASDVVEGVVDLVDGDYIGATEHLVGVAVSLLQVGAFAVGGRFVGEVVKPRLSSFIEGAKPVRLANGAERLWGQDLKPYQQNDVRLPAHAKADASGLYQHQGKSILRLDAGDFELKQDPQTGKRRIVHPRRVDAYQPEAASNGSGAFVIEGETPHAWDEQTLMKRLGPQMAEIADVFADVRAVSRTDTSALRRMYTDNERAIPLLADTANRFTIDREVRSFIQRMGSSVPEDYLGADPVWQFQLLDGWPGKPIDLIGTDANVLARIGGGNATPVRLHVGRLPDGDLVKSVLSNLNETEIKRLFNEEFGAQVGSPDVNAKRLRAELCKRAGERQTALFDTRYRSIEGATSAEGRLIQDQVRGLPGNVAQELVTLATPAEMQALGRGQLPRRLENFARWALRDVRLSRAYEGFHLESVDNPDTKTLALHSLKNLPGWNPEVRIDIHQYRYGGRQLDSIGGEEGALRRTLVAGENGDFQAFDEDGNSLQSSSDFYTSILQALPDAERTALNLRIGEGQKLKGALRDHALKPYELLNAFNDLPVLKPTTFDPAVMRLRGGNPATGELAQLKNIEQAYPALSAVAFHPSVPIVERYDYLRGLKLLHENYPDEHFQTLFDGFNKANATGDPQANRGVAQSVEVLPDLQKLMLPEHFDALIERLFTDDGLIPLTQAERDLGSYARNLQQTGRTDEYQALLAAVSKDPGFSAPSLSDLHSYSQQLDQEVASSREPAIVTPRMMADLQQAQRAIYRAKELLPLSGNQLPSIWEKGGSAIAKIKGIRGLDLQEGDFTARLTTAEHARKAIEIKGGNCSENSKVTFSILASQPRTSRIHIVKATAFDHQYVVIGDDLNNLEQLVVADSWPEFPAAHSADAAYFTFELPALQTLDPGPADPEFAFINDLPPGQAQLPAVSQANTFRQIKMNKLYKHGAYAQFTSLKQLGGQYSLPGEVGVSFERMPDSVIDKRVSAWEGYETAFESLLADNAANSPENT